MKYLILIALFLFSWRGLPAQQSITENGMTFSYEIKDETISVKLKAPTTGWVGLGFNQKNQIVNSDLLLFRVREGKADGLDMYVVGFGNPKNDQELGGTSDFKALTGYEKDGYTHLTFNLPMDTNDKFDFKHTLGQRFWLILAYSVDDDFGHHSRMRTHVEFAFTE